MGSVACVGYIQSAARAVVVLPAWAGKLVHPTHPRMHGPATPFLQLRPARRMHARDGGILPAASRYGARQTVTMHCQACAYVPAVCVTVLLASKPPPPLVFPGSLAKCRDHQASVRETGILRRRVRSGKGTLSHPLACVHLRGFHAPVLNMSCVASQHDSSTPPAAAAVVALMLILPHCSHSTSHPAAHMLSAAHMRSAVHMRSAPTGYPDAVVPGRPVCAHTCQPALSIHPYSTLQRTCSCSPCAHLMAALALHASPHTCISAHIHTVHTRCR